MSSPLVAAASSSYHGYGHSGYGHSNYGHGSYSDGHDCCPLVTDPKTWIALLSFIAAATYFLRIEVTMSMLMMAGKKRRKRRSGLVNPALDILNSGKKKLTSFIL